MTNEEEEAFRRAIRECQRVDKEAAIALVVAAPSASIEQRVQIDEDLFAVLSFRGGMGILVPQGWADEGSEDGDRITAILRQETGDSGPLN